MPSPSSASRALATVCQSKFSKPTSLGTPTSLPSCPCAKRTRARCTASVPMASAHSRAPCFLLRTGVGRHADEIEADLDALHDLRRREESDATIVERRIGEPESGGEWLPADSSAAPRRGETRSSLRCAAPAGTRRTACPRLVSIAAVRKVVLSCSWVTRKSRISCRPRSVPVRAAFAASVMIDDMMSTPCERMEMGHPAQLRSSDWLGDGTRY